MRASASNHTFLTARRVARYAHSHGLWRLASYASALRFSMVGFLASGAFLGRAYFDYFFVIVAGIAILNRLAKTEPMPSLDDEEPETEQWELPHSGGVPA